MPDQAEAQRHLAGGSVGIPGVEVTGGVAPDMRHRASPDETQTVPYHGFEFTFASCDGELRDVELEDADEFLEHHGDSFSEGRLDEGYSAEAMCRWAQDNLADRARGLMDTSRMWTLAEQYGVRAFGPPE